MFGLLKLIAILCVGAVLGFHLNSYLMETECSAAVGNWSGTVCIVNEPQQ